MNKRRWRYVEFVCSLDYRLNQIELIHRQMFKKFQEAHPEMDFSNAKIGGMGGDSGFPGFPQ